jgi:hypothetical protein
MYSNRPKHALAVQPMVCLRAMCRDDSVLQRNFDEQTFISIQLLAMPANIFAGQAEHRPSS